MKLQSKDLFIVTINIISLLIPFLLIIYSLKVLIDLDAETGLNPVAIQKYTFFRNIALAYFSILILGFRTIFRHKKSMRSILMMPVTFSVVGVTSTLLAFAFAALLYDYVVPLFR